MIHLTPEQIDARRLEYAQIEEQIRVLGRRKSILKGEILSGYAAPAKGAAPEQLSLDTATTTTTASAPSKAPVQGKEAAKPATATTPATDRDVKPGKPLDATLFKPSKHPEHLLPTLTGKGKRAVLDLLKSAPGGRMPLREITARLGLPDALPLPSECYYQSGDWVLKETPKASKKLAPSKPAPKAKPAAKKPARAPKKAKVKPTLALGDQIYITLREWGTWYDVGHLEAAVRGAMPLNAGPSTRDWNGVLADMLRSQRIERREEGGRVQFRLAPLPKAKKPVEAPKPTRTVGEAVKKIRSEVSVHGWQRAREEVCTRIAQCKGRPLSVGELLLTCNGDLVAPVIELLEMAEALSVGRTGTSPVVVTPSAAISDEEIAHDLQALSRRYLRGLVDDLREPPTTASLAEMLELPVGLVESVLRELRDGEELLCDAGGRWSVRSPRPTAQARTLPLIPGVDPAPASGEPCPT